MTHTQQTESIHNPFLDLTDQTTFHVYPAWSQRLHMIRRLFDGPSRLLLIVGDRGSGKTLMMKQFLAQDEAHWKTCRINAHDVTDLPGDDRVRGMTEHRAYMHSGHEWPAVMMDDAHMLSLAELAFLIRLTGSKGYQRELGKLILFGESSLLPHVSELTGMISEAGAVEKVFMPHMTLAETQAYVSKRLSSAGYAKTPFFTSSDMERIQEESGGCPGGINHAASRLFIRKNQEGSRLKTFFKQFFT